MTYIALLCGINVGGKAKVSMADLKLCFESEGLTAVKTYINSGNVVFKATQTTLKKLMTQLERAIERDIHLQVRVLVITAAKLRAISESIPNVWADPSIRCYALFLWPASDKASVLKDLLLNAQVETAHYTSGAVVHMCKKTDATKSRLNRITGTPLYQNVTMRNLNAVHKLVELSTP